MKFYQFILIATIFIGCQNQQKTVKKESMKTSFYVGTYTNKESKGIYKYEVSKEGVLHKIGLVAETQNPSFLVKTNDNKTLLAVNEVDVDGSGFVSAFAIHKDSLQFINNSNSGGEHPCFITINNTNDVLVANYTGGNVQKRNAALCLNMNGGGGLEIWQFTEREVLWPKEEIYPGDLGIHSLKIKCIDIEKAYSHCKERKLKVLSEIRENSFFLLEDLFGNKIEIRESMDWFSNSNGIFGGVFGVAIGVSDMEKSLKFYGDLLGFSKVVSNKKGQFDDFNSWTGKNESFHRVIIEKSTKNLILW